MKASILARLTVLLLLTATKANAEPSAVPAPSPAPPNPSAPAQNPADPNAGNKDNNAKGGEEKKPDKIISDGYIPEPVAAARDLILHGNFKDAGQWLLILTKVDKPSLRIAPISGTVSSDKTSVTFNMPVDLEDGRYFGALQLNSVDGKGNKYEAVPGELRVPAPAALKVTVDKVQAKDAYPYPNKNNKYDFEIAGTNFSRNLPDNHVLINGVELTLRCHGCLSTDPSNPELLADVDSPTTKLIVHDYTPPGYSNPLEVSVRVGIDDNIAKAPKPLMFSSISRNRLQVYALGSFLLVVGLLFVAVQVRAKRRGDKFWSLRSFLIDQDTNSYSLSKFQLTLFTLVTIFGYIYVFVCDLFVQWKFVLPPVPENLPTMLGLSVGTSVVAAGIGTRIGGKGAGPESPSAADFISAGGIVLPERFQFFLWTIVSSGGVLALILASDPATVNELPKLPDGLIYLMGLSSAGYLGGKLVRGPGPSVRSLDVIRKAVDDKGVGPVLQFMLTGDNLHADASFQLDDEHIPVAQVKTDAKTPEPGGNPKMCSALGVVITKVANRYFDGTHTLTITNPDSQAAVVRYGATIESVTKGDLEGNEVKFTVTGSNFKDPSSAGWVVADNDIRNLGTNAVTKKSEVELELRVPQALAAGSNTAKLCIVGPGTTPDLLITTFDLQSKTMVATPPKAFAQLGLPASGSPPNGPNSPPNGPKSPPNGPSSPPNAPTSPPNAPTSPPSGPNSPPNGPNSPPDETDSQDESLQSPPNGPPPGADDEENSGENSSGAEEP